MKKTLIAIFLIFSMFLLEGCFTKEYIVDFETFSDQTIESMSVKENEEIELPTLETDGIMVFAGWYLNKDYTSNKCDQTYKVTSNVTLYAKWVVANEVTLTIKSKTDNDLKVEILVREEVEYNIKELIELIDPFYYKVREITKDGETIENIVFHGDTTLYSDIKRNIITGEVTLSPKLEYFANEKITMDGMELTMTNNSGQRRVIAYDAEKEKFEFDIPKMDEIYFDRKFDINGIYDGFCHFTIKNFMVKELKVTDIIIYGEFPSLIYYEDVNLNGIKLFLQFNNNDKVEVNMDDVTFEAVKPFKENGVYDYRIKVLTEINGITYFYEKIIQLNLYNYVDNKDINYTIINNAVSISGLTESGLQKSVIKIPDEIENTKVVSILDKAFFDNQIVTKIILGNNVKYIGADCFNGCINLKTFIYSSKNINKLNKQTFYNCTNLEAIDLQNTKYIGENCFFNCSSLVIDKITLNDATIESEAFNQVKLIKYIEIVKGNTFGKNCFSGANIESLKYGVENSLSKDDVINNFQGIVIKKVETYSNNSFNKELVNLVQVSDLLINVNSDSFKEEEFKDSAYLEKVDLICDGKFTFKKNAFNGCTSLKELNIDATRVSSFVFEEGSLYNVQLKEFNCDNCVINKAFNEHNVLETIKFKNVAMAPESFKSSQYLKNLTVTGNFVCGDVKTNKGSVFEGCPLLTNVNINNIEHILPSTFEDCPSIKTIEFGKNLKTIGNNAFNNTSITELNIPKTFEKFDEGALLGINLKSVTIENSDKYYIDDHILFEKQDNGKVNIIKALNDFSQSSYFIEDNVDTILSEAFYYIDKLTSINIKTHNLIKLCDNIVSNGVSIKVSPFVYDKYTSAYPNYNFSQVNEQLVLDIVYDENNINSFFVPFGYNLENIDTRYFYEQKFLYWYYLEDVNGELVEKQVNLPFIINSNIQLFAKWEKVGNNLTLKYNHEELNDKTLISTDFDFSKPNVNGDEKFVGWFYNGKLIDKFPHEVTKEEYNNLTLVAHWEYKITFRDIFFETAPDKPLTTIELTFKTNESLDIPTLTYKNFEFNGWLFDSNKDGLPDSDIKVTKVDKVFKIRNLCSSWKDLVAITSKDDLKQATKKLNYVIVNDIDLTGIEPISSFIGTLDGLNHTLTNFNFTLSDKSYNKLEMFGLFKENYGEIQNIKFTNSKIDSKEFHDNYNLYVGLLAGRNFGKINNITFTNCEVNVNRRSSYYGIVCGLANNIISNVVVKTSSVFGYGDSGIIAGISDNATLNNITINKCKNTLNINKLNKSIGGVIGYSKNTTYDQIDIDDMKFILGEMKDINPLYLNPSVGPIIGTVDKKFEISGVKIKQIDLSSYYYYLDEKYSETSSDGSIKTNNQEKYIKSYYNGLVGRLIK